MASEKLVITNIGQILSGKLEAPILDGDCVVSIDGRKFSYQRCEAIAIAFNPTISFGRPGA